MDLARAFLAENPDAVGRAVCEGYTSHVDSFVVDVFERAAGGRPGVALLAVGGYGRRDLSPGSDLDLLLLHDAVDDVGRLAEAILYPLWDVGAKVGHAVRSRTEALELAAADMDSATALLSARHLGGDRAMASALIGDATEQWRHDGEANLAAMARRVRDRHGRAGEVAFLLEPDLKEGRGGLRDVQSIRWAEQAGGAVWPNDTATLADAYGVLTDARVELHRHSGRPTNVLTLQDQDPVATALGFADADDLMRAVSSAARAVAFCSDRFWRRVEVDTGRAVRHAARPDRVLGPGVALRDGAVGLHARPSAMAPTTPVEVAASAAQVDAPIRRETLDALAGAGAMPDPWPLPARHALVALLSAGRPAIRQIEDLDHHGLMAALLPEWDAVRSKPQRNAYHTFTVDRHLCETAANAAGLAGRVRRRDLLVLGAFLHDIGKGLPGDHTANGMAMVADIGRRMAFGDGDVETLVAMVEHHLLLPDVATRRDLDDPDVIERVADTVGTLDRLQLLHALVIADSKATGPAAWSPWKAELVDTLVRRVTHVLGGGEAADTTDDFPDAALAARAATGDRVVEVVDGDLIVIDDDRPGLFARVAGSLALHGLDVVDANIATVNGRAVERIGVHPGRHGAIDWGPVVADVHLALDGQLAIRARLALRADTYRRVVPRPTAPVQIHFHADESSSATIVDVFAPDAIGALYRITSALAELDLDLVRARIQTMGDGVVDSFYVVDANGSKLAEPVMDEVRLAVVHALGG